MSIKLMSAAWEMDLPATEKMVLLCLCDHANDAGVCWPSVERMAKKCSVSDRTVQRSIKRLVEVKILTVEDAPGRPHKFTIDPRQLVTPDTVSPPTMTTEPPTQCHPTPDTVSPEPSKNHQEPSIDSSSDDERFKPDHVFEFWNEIAPGMEKRCIRARTHERRVLVKARMANHDLSEFREAFDNFKRSDFLRRANGCHFDWFMQKKNFLKVLEGNYNNG